MSSYRDRLRAQVKRLPDRLQSSSGRRVDGSASQGEQRLLAQSYRLALHLNAPLPTLAETEFRNYSQNGEDGILLFLTTILDMPNQRIVELGSSDGIECNSANLILHSNWSALLCDGDSEALARGQQFYAEQPETHRIGPTLAHSWITRDNVRALLSEHGYAESVDVLSVDIDGNDLWIVEVLEPTAPIVLVEYNARLPADVSLSVPYADDFAAADIDPDKTHGEGFFGASLLAFRNVLGRSGYRLVGANSINTNAFFVRAGVGEEVLPEVSVESCLGSAWARHMQARWWETLQQRDWVEIS